MAELKPNITGWIQDGIAAIRTPEMKLSIKKAFFTDGRFEEIRSRALSQKKADELQQELWEELMLYHYSQRLLEDERSISGSLREQLSQLKSDSNDREWQLLEQIAYLNSCTLKREQG